MRFLVGRLEIPVMETCDLGIPYQMCPGLILYDYLILTLYISLCLYCMVSRRSKLTVLCSIMSCMYYISMGETLIKFSYLILSYLPRIRIRNPGGGGTLVIRGWIRSLLTFENTPKAHISRQKSNLIF